MPAPASAEEIRRVNVAYHDEAATHYDAKWGVQYGPVGRAQVLQKVAKALGTRKPPRFASALEVGAGTGYFSLNLAQLGVVGEVAATDISPGMVDRLRANAADLGLEVDARVADAEALPFEDESFDLVLGHAVLHHLPDLDRAFAEFRRVLKPGGAIVFAGEPSRYGDVVAGPLKRAAWELSPVWRAVWRIPGRPAEADAQPDAPHGPAAGEDLEAQVDVHAFAPADLTRVARAAGFTRVRVSGEELLANWFGWTNRTLEASADPTGIPRLWTQYAYRGYLALQEVDRALLEGRLPAAAFYNLLLSARKPA